MKKYTVVFTPTFEKEIREIALKLQELTQNEAIVNKIYRQILDSADSLEYFPEANQEFAGIRIQLVGKYSIVYRIREDRVEIMRIVPSSSQYIVKLRGFS